VDNSGGIMNRAALLEEGDMLLGAIVAMQMLNLN
jgi:hypothetical protein